MYSTIIYNSSWTGETIEQLNQELNLALTLQDNVSAARRLSPEADSEYRLIIRQIETLADNLRITRQALQSFMEGMEHASNVMIAEINEQNGQPGLFG